MTHQSRPDNYNRYSGNSAVTGVGFEPTVSQTIGESSSPRQSQSGSDTEEDSVFEIRDKDAAQQEKQPDTQKTSSDASAAPDCVPLMFSQDGSRYEPLHMVLGPENAQAFKSASYFGAGIYGHSADEQAFAHPLSATGRRRESIILSQIHDPAATARKGDEDDKDSSAHVYSQEPDSLE